MPNRAVIHTDNAPEAIGPYSQAVKINNTVYLSGQIPLDPTTMEIVSGGFEAQVEQVFKNLASVCQASGGNLQSLVKLNIFLTDLSNFAAVNEAMARHIQEPYPARAALGVKELPKGSLVEIDGILVV